MESHSNPQIVEKLIVHIMKKIEEIDKSLEELGHIWHPKHAEYAEKALRLKTHAIKLKNRKVKTKDFDKWSLHLYKSFLELRTLANELKIAPHQIRADRVLDRIEKLSNSLQKLLGDKEYTRQIKPIADEPRKMIEALAKSFIEAGGIIKLSDLTKLLPTFEKIKNQLQEQYNTTSQLKIASRRQLRHSQDEKKEPPKDQPIHNTSTPIIKKRKATVSSMGLLANTQNAEPRAQNNLSKNTENRHTVRMVRRRT